MNIKEIENKFSENNIKVKDFKIITSYCITLEDGGAIFLDNLCNITGINGTPQRREQLSKIFNYTPTTKPKRRQLIMKGLEKEITRLNNELSKKEK